MPVEEVQIKSTIGYHFISSKMAKKFCENTKYTSFCKTGRKEVFSNHNSKVIWEKINTFDYIKIKLCIAKYTMSKVKGQMEN